MKAKVKQIKQSVAFWCFENCPEKWTLKRTAEAALNTGCESVELLFPAQIPIVTAMGLKCAVTQIDMASYPPFVKGFNNPKYLPEVLKATRGAIDGAAANGSPSVIAFSGYRFRDVDNPAAGSIDAEEGMANCVAGLKKIAGYAEKKKVCICLEMLNTLPDPDPMKGHPGYQGDSLEWCARIVRAVGSPQVKLLFDAYHVQLMGGNLINQIMAFKDIIGHVHFSGCPGRGNLDNTQEINFAGLVNAFLEAGYQGYIGHEFLPVGDPFTALANAVELCRR
jgi:hydroxypyruvate isomerase